MLRKEKFPLPNLIIECIGLIENATILTFDQHFYFFLLVRKKYAKFCRLDKSSGHIPLYQTFRCIEKRLTRLSEESFVVAEICHTLQRQNTEISKQIFPEKEYRDLSPNFHIHASVTDLYIPTMGHPILLEEICRPILGLYKSLTDT